jgi:hypothetical protein
MSSPLEPSNWLEITYYDEVDEKWKKIEIALDDVNYDDKKLFRSDLDKALQDIFAMIERMKIRYELDTQLWDKKNA